MGYNTTVFILNDSLDAIARHADEFVAQLVDACGSGKPDRLVGQTTVIRPGHADVFRLYATHGNAITELGAYSDDMRRAESDARHAGRLLADVERALMELRTTRTALRTLLAAGSTDR